MSATCPRCHAPHGMSPGLMCSWCAWGWGRNPGTPQPERAGKQRAMLKIMDGGQKR